MITINPVFQSLLILLSFLATLCVAFYLGYHRGVREGVKLGQDIAYGELNRSLYQAQYQSRYGNDSEPRFVIHEPSDSPPATIPFNDKTREVK